MAYCTLIVQPAPMNTQTNTAMLVTVATAVGESPPGTTPTRASEKPITYMATETACAKKKTTPIAPPNSTPRLRLMR